MSKTPPPSTPADHRRHLEDMRHALAGSGRKPAAVEGVLRSYIRSKRLDGVAVARFPDGEVRLVWKNPA